MPWSQVAYKSLEFKKVGFKHWNNSAAHAFGLAFAALLTGCCAGGLYCSVRVSSTSSLGMITYHGCLAASLRTSDTRYRSSHLFRGLASSAYSRLYSNRFFPFLAAVTTGPSAVEWSS